MSFNGRRAVRNESGPLADPYQPNTSKLMTRLIDVFLRTFDLGFTGFGGPPVHFQIFHKRFVDGMGKTPWIDEQTYQELFAICQALPGPGSTKMLFNIAQIHAGMIPAIFVFLLWSLPAAIGMFGLSLGVQRISDVLPGQAYGLISGLNASTVGIIALSAVQLARKAITDPLTRIVVTFTGCAGLCYNSLWYFPVLLVSGGLITFFWDCFAESWLRQWRTKKRGPATPPVLEEQSDNDNIPMQDIQKEESNTSGLQRRQTQSVVPVPTESTPGSIEENRSPDNSLAHGIPVKTGGIVIAAFFAIFAVFMALRSSLHPPPLLLQLFNNMFLAGTIIIGGGPIVIPLLRDYVVGPGWVSPRDFLLGLAVIQAMPGPNFNIAVYLGALVIAGPAAPKSVPTIVGAVLGFLGIFTPGLWLSVGFQSIWQTLRKHKEVTSALRGVNAAAVGFVFTAVYRLWAIGYLTKDANQGISLGQEPWWLVIAATTYTAVEWFSVPPPVAIIGGGTAGLAWWGAVGRHFKD